VVRYAKVLGRQRRHRSVLRGMREGRLGYQAFGFRHQCEALRAMVSFFAPLHGSSTGILGFCHTFSVRRMFSNFADKLWNDRPVPVASFIVQRPHILHRLLGLLRQLDDIRGPVWVNILPGDSSSSLIHLDGVDSIDRFRGLYRRHTGQKPALASIKRKIAITKE